MPRKALVSKEEAIVLIEKYIDVLQPTPSWSSKIWKQMSEELDGRWKEHNIYVNFMQDRRQVRSIAFKNCGRKEDVNISVVNSSLDITEIEETDPTFEAENEAAGLDEFHVPISTEEWREMLTCDGKYFRSGVWSDILYQAIRKNIRILYR